MKRLIALACAGVLAAAMTGCSAPTGSAAEAPQESAAATKAAETASASAERSAESTKEAAPAESSATAAASVAADAAATAEAAVSAANEAAQGAGENEAAGLASSADTAAAEESASEAGGTALIDSAAASQISGLLETGDFEGAIAAAKEAGSETLTNSLQALADAAAACNITTEPNSGNTIIYGDSATVVDGTTNVIPFVNMTHGFTHMQIGFVDKFDDPNGYHDGSPTSVELSAGGDSWSWDTDASNTVTVPQDSARTWVFETALSDTDSALLNTVGQAAPGSAAVQFKDAAAGNLDYTLSDAETAACSHIGVFTSALQLVRNALHAA